MDRSDGQGGGGSAATIGDTDPSELGFGAEGGCTQHSFVIVIDDEGLIVFANTAALSAFGLSQEDALGCSVFRHVVTGDLERVLVHHALVLQFPDTVVADSIHFASADGEIRTFEVETSNRLRLAHVTGIVMKGREVTERDRFRSRFRMSLDEGSEAVTRVIEGYDPFIAGHQQQVTDIATAIARDLGLSSDTVRGIGVAATFHDIGEIAESSGMLSRPGGLTSAEFEKVKLHPEAGAQIVSGISFPWPVADMIRQHHERMDGSGYPRGLSGDEILLGAQIIAVADVVSAMSSFRLYRPAIGTEAALTEIENKRRCYRPEVVDSCLRLFREQGFRLRPVGFGQA